MNKEQEEILGFLQREIFIEKSLESLASTYCLYWVHTVKCDQKREEIIQTTIEAINKNK